MTIAWEDDLHRVIHWTLTGELDWAELDQTMATAEVMLDSVSTPVYVLALVDNFRLPSDTPMHFPAVAQRRYWQHPRLGATIAVGADHFFKMMIDIYRQVYEVIGTRIYVAQTIEEAYQIIEDVKRTGPAAAEPPGHDPDQ
jgi:hypothetical protein